MGLSKGLHAKEQQQLIDMAAGQVVDAARLSAWRKKQVRRSHVSSVLDRVATAAVELPGALDKVTGDYTQELNLILEMIEEAAQEVERL